MNWVKKGLIYRPDDRRPWARSHAQVPLVDRVDDNTLRIYYGTRDEFGRTLTTFIDVDSEDPAKVKYEHRQPILPLGKVGCFDDSGVMPSEIVSVGGVKYFFYVGWNISTTARYRTALGLAISEDGGETFRKVSEGPVMDRSTVDPISVSCQSILVENGLWRTWYMSYIRWEERSGVMEPFYEIKYAESKDGICWERKGVTAVAPEDDEGGLACPSVIKDGGVYRMWYSVRGGENYRADISQSYRIGYAESSDGIDWERKDPIAGIGLSAEGWDSEMIAYPFVLKIRGKLLMFYNGNGFGRSGFGYAELQE